MDGQSSRDKGYNMVIYPVMGGFMSGVQDYDCGLCFLFLKLNQNLGKKKSKRGEKAFSL